MTPIHQRVAPVRVLYVTLRLLGLVAVYVADDPPYVIEVVLVVVGLVFVQNLDDPATRLVALRLAPAVLLA